MADEPRGQKPSKRSVSLRRLLVAGTLVWLPIIATVWVVTFFVTLMDRTLVLLPERFWSGPPANMVRDAGIQSALWLIPLQDTTQHVAGIADIKIISARPPPCERS